MSPTSPAPSVESSSRFERFASPKHVRGFAPESQNPSCITAPVRFAFIFHVHDVHGMNRASSEQPLFAVIGCGLIGRKRVIALGKNPPLLYACDLELSRAADLAKLAPGCSAVTDYTTVLADARVTAVIVSTLNASLAPI